MPAQADEGRALLEKMIGTLSHRGPDGFGFRLDGPVGLAHSRLAIIDLAGGDQPIRNEDGSVWVVFNGEIFNYVELREALEARGHRFYTHSDTEVIVHLYEEHGDGFVTHLNGQFAIALWDAPRQRLVLARDRAGIRPLYYSQRGSTLCFGSEMKALFAADPGLAVVSPLGLAQTLTYWAPLDPDTVYREVRSVPPGHVLVATAAGETRLHRYWDWTFPARDSQTLRTPGTIEDAAAQLRELLIDAVRLQLRADVPVGAYLSGGLDSSAIVALVRGFTSAPVRTFSVAFEDAEFDESDHQSVMVKFLGTDHTSLRCKTSDIGAAFPEFIRHTETPVLRTAGVPLMLLSGDVRRQGYKVVLTGEGADEVFGGYDLFKEAKIRRFWAAQPGSAIRPRLFERLYGYLGSSPVANASLARTFFGTDLNATGRAGFAHGPRWTTSSRALGFLSESCRAELGSWAGAAHLEARVPAELSSWTPLARDQYVEARTLLACYLLAFQGDRVAMANSVEGRVPFLDHRIIEFANRVPDRWKIRGLTEKYLFRRALEGLLPPEILWRTKQPYRAPDSLSFFPGGRALGYVDYLLSPPRLAESGYFDAARVGRLVEKCRAGRAIGFADNQAFVGILSTMLTDELFVRRRSVPCESAARAQAIDDNHALRRQV
jgi:asparagine synthase (glutamine-hydrolysing)